MKIQCENCASAHDLEPPSWVISSGRPFRFRCSACGHSQMANPPTGIVMSASTLSDVTTAKPSPPRPSAPPATSPLPEPATSQSVFLKQDGKVYLVRDWATLQRWIMENRVDRDDMVSEGGVDWDRVGSRAELGSFFMAIEKIEAAELAGIGLSQDPLSSDPPTSEAGSFARLDEPTEGVPVGLPPLPTEEIFDLAAQPEPEPEDVYPEQPPARSFTDIPADLGPDPESSTIEEAPPAELEPDGPSLELVVDAPPESDESPEPDAGDVPESKVVEFPDLSFEPPLANDVEEQSLDDVAFSEPHMDLPDPADPPALSSDFGDFGSFTDATPLPGGFDNPPTETDVPESDPFPEEEDEYLDPTELAAPSTSFDDRFGQDNLLESDLLEVDNTEILEPEDPFADFGDFFLEEDDQPAALTGGNSGRGRLAAGLIAGGAVLGAIIYFAVMGLPSFLSPDTVAKDQTSTDDAAAATSDNAQDATADAADDNTEDQDAVDENAATEDAPTEDAPTEDAPTEDAPTEDVATEDAPTEAVATEETTTENSPVEEVAGSATADEPQLNEWAETGWKALDRSRFQIAITNFEKVLEANTAHLEANYGMGYALIKQGKRNDARDFLCTAYNASFEVEEAITTFRDVRGLLKSIDSWDGDSPNCPESN